MSSSPHSPPALFSRLESSRRYYRLQAKISGHMLYVRWPVVPPAASIWLAGQPLQRNLPGKQVSRPTNRRTWGLIGAMWRPKKWKSWWYGWRVWLKETTTRIMYVVCHYEKLSNNKIIFHKIKSKTCLLCVDMSVSFDMISPTSKGLLDLISYG